MPSENTERSQRARIAALARVSQEPSGTAMTEAARSKFRQGFYDRTDPSLPHEERQRQADAAYKLHMTRLSRRAALARRRVTEAMQEASEALTELAESADAV